MGAACRMQGIVGARVCVCVSRLPWELLTAGVTCSNGKLCCTVQNLFPERGHPTARHPPSDKGCHILVTGTHLLAHVHPFARNFPNFFFLGEMCG